MARELKQEPIRRWGKQYEDEADLPVSIKSGYPFLKGEFAGLRQVQSQFGPGFLLDIDINGERQTWGCPALLQSRLRQITRLGTWIAIVPIGMVKTRQGEGYDFKVFILDGEKDMPPDPLPEDPTE